MHLSSHLSMRRRYPSVSWWVEYTWRVLERIRQKTMPLIKGTKGTSGSPYIDIAVWWFPLWLWYSKMASGFMESRCMCLPCRYFRGEITYSEREIEERSISLNRGGWIRRN